MDRMDYIQTASRIRVFETRLLSKPRIERMVDAKDLDEVIKILGETEYLNVMNDFTKISEYEKILSGELKRVYKLMYEMSKDSVVVDILALKYDYHNLKVLIKEKLLNKDFSDLYIFINTMDFKKFRGDYLNNNKDLNPKFKEVIENAIKIFKETNDPQKIDLIVDKYYFEDIYHSAKKSNVELFVDYVESLIDFTNIKSLIRVKKQGKDINFLEEVIFENGNIKKEKILLSLDDNLDVILNKFKNHTVGTPVRKGLESYKESNRLSDFEKEMDNFLMDMNKASKYIIIGPEPVFSYIIAKETEIKILRIIMVSKLNNISPDNIRERLRDLYV